MRAIEFPAKVSEDGKISLPEEIACEVPHDTELRVMNLLKDYDDINEEDEAWDRLSVEGFFSDDSELDKKYDNL